MQTTRATSPSNAGRFHAELKFLVGLVAGLAVFVVALIAEALWGNDVMAAILLAAVALFLVARYVPRALHGRPRTH